MKRLLVALVLFGAGVPTATQTQRTVIAVGTLLDGRGHVLRNTRIVVQGDRIASIDATASPVDYDLGRMTVMPGWIDTHVHINWHFDANGKSVSGGESPDEAALATAEDACSKLQNKRTVARRRQAIRDRHRRLLRKRPDQR